MRSERQIANQRKRDKIRRANPLEKIKHREFRRKRYQDPEYRKKVRTAQKNKYATNLLHRQKQIENQRLYRKTTECKELHKKVRARRKRELGFKPANKYFEGSHAHHLDTQNVIYIPSELHKSVFHKQTDENSMKQINILAWSFMESEVY